MSSSGLRGWHRPQMEKPARLEGQEGAGGSPGVMAPAKVTSDKERGKSGASKDESPETNLLFAGCDLELLRLTPQTEGSGALIALHKQLLVQSLLQGSSASPRKVTPNPVPASQDKSIPCLSMTPERGCAAGVLPRAQREGDTPRALWGCRGQGLGALQ